MPFSLATSVRAWLRLGVGFACAVAMLCRSPVPLLKLELQIGLRDVAKGDAEIARALHLQDHGVLGDLADEPGEVPPWGLADGGKRLHLHPLALDALEVLALLERAVEAR